MTLNEGFIGGDNRTYLKSVMLRQLDRLKETTPDLWERAVFESLTGRKREDVDWEIKDNHAGYYTWIRSFDMLVSELEEDGYVQSIYLDENRKILKKTLWDPAIAVSELVYAKGGNGKN